MTLILDGSLTKTGLGLWYANNVVMPVFQCCSRKPLYAFSSKNQCPVCGKTWNTPSPVGSLNTQHYTLDVLCWAIEKWTGIRTTCDSDTIYIHLS